MPNWCQNHLIIEGPREHLDRFRDTVSATRDDGKPIAFLIGAIVLEPPAGDPRRVPSDTCEGGWDWYAWRVENWGSKWDVCDSALVEDGARLVYTFDSAWAPPREGIRRISLAYPELEMTFTWFEFGMEFYGRAELRDGNATEIFDRKFGEGAIDYDEDADEYEIVDPDLRELVETHGFNLCS